MNEASKDTFALLRYFTLKRKNPEIDFNAFLDFVKKYIDRYRKERPSLEVLAGDTEQALAEQLDTLARNQYLTLESENGKIRKVVFPQYYLDLANDAYKPLDTNPELPLPSRDSLGKNIPDDMYRTVEVQTEFMQIIEHPEQFRYKVLRLVFPDHIREIVTTAEFVQKRLIEYCIAKIRLYLNTQRNADYVRHKLLVVFQRRDLILKDTLDSIIIRPAQAAANFMNPSEFVFSFWAHFTNFIIQEYKQKESKMTEEHGYCQAAYILGYYSSFFKGRVQKERDEDNALRLLLTGMKLPPYVFSITDILGMKDKNGIRVAKRTSSERIHAFIESKLVPEKDKALAEIIRRKGADNALFFIHRDSLFPYMIRQLPQAASSLRDRYLAEWTEHFRQYHRTPEMTDDAAFSRDLESRLRIEQPFLTSLLDYDLLSVARREVQGVPDMMVYINSMFSDSKAVLKPIPEILGLRRSEIFDTARLKLSFWELMPDLRKIVTFLKRLFPFGKKKRGDGKEAALQTVSAAGAGRTGNLRPLTFDEERTVRKAVVEASPVQEKNSGRNSAAQSAAYNAAIMKLKLRLVGKDGSVERSLEDLAEKWNPLYDEAAKRNLVEDTNSMIRDYFRSLKRGFRIKPPDLARIQNLAETLAENKAFIRIRRKDLFLEYIKIYLLKLLGER